jgi:AcrR family transcriptional regulator
MPLELNTRSDNHMGMARTQGSFADTTGPKVHAAALRLFADHGFAAVSMRQIAREVGVQAGALYLYTPDKQTLLFDLMRGHMEKLLADWTPPDASPAVQLEDFTRHHIRFHLDRTDLVFIAYMELRNLSPANFVVIEDLRRDYETRLETILRAGSADGSFDFPDPKLATMAIIAMLTGVTTWFRDKGRLSRADVEAIYWDMVRKSVSI